MKAYRKRFIQLNMLLLGVVLLIMMAAVAVYMSQDYYNELRTTMEQVVEPLSAFRGPESLPPLPHTDKPRDPGSRMRKRVTMVFYVPMTGEISVLSQASWLEEEELDAVLQEIVAREEPFGTVHAYRSIYYRSGNEQFYKIAIAPTSYITWSMIELILLLALVWLAAMLLLLLVTIQLSKLAVRPMETAMAREKQFIADISHDLKTPLSVILANNSILREDPQATVGSQRKWIDSTEDAARSIRQLIDEMLTLSDAERSDAPLTTAPVDVSALVTRAVLQMESVAYDKGVDLESDIEEHIVLPTNADYLQRIVTSLVENAIKYEPAGGAVYVTLAPAGQLLRLQVRNGRSVIPAEDLPHIFERFYRGDKSRQLQGGHGLGLAIAQQMAQRLGGRLQADSGEEIGTVFTAAFPLE